MKVHVTRSLTNYNYQNIISKNIHILNKFIPVVPRISKRKFFYGKHKLIRIHYS